MHFCGGDTLTARGNKELSNGVPTWTKGMVLDDVSMTSSKYEIKETAGNTYMFLEWKSGGISEPWDFVFKKAE